VVELCPVSEWRQPCEEVSTSKAGNKSRETGKASAMHVRYIGADRGIWGSEGATHTIT